MGVTQSMPNSSEWPVKLVCRAYVSSATTTPILEDNEETIQFTQHSINVCVEP